MRGIHGKLPLEREIWNTPEHDAWLDHFHNCKLCSNWELEQRVIERGEDPKIFPCVHIADAVSEAKMSKLDPWQDPDILIVKTSSGYGIPVRDGGTSWVTIHFCPWCGAGLEIDT